MSLQPHAPYPIPEETQRVARAAFPHGNLYMQVADHLGLPLRRYQVWTGLHNSDCRAAEGTTPASRFFRWSFPDLFESVLSQIDELPMPRQRRQALAVSD
jgi:hypothetical protein